MITHSRETVFQPNSTMRWDRDIFNGSTSPKMWAMSNFPMSPLTGAKRREWMGMGVAGIMIDS